MHGPLFLLQHGVDGSARDLVALEDALRKRFGPAGRVFVFRPTCNEGMRTHDPIAVQAERLVAATTAFVRGCATPSPLALVAVGHSLGGLVLRAALPGILAANPPWRFVPAAYVSLSTPHLGSRRPSGGTLGAGVWRAAVHGAVTVLFGHAGQELLLQDTGRALFGLADPHGEPMRALRRFPSVTFVAVPHGDLQVPFCSASARPDNPYDAAGTSPTGMRVAGFDGLPQSHVALLWPHMTAAAQRTTVSDGFASAGPLVPAPVAVAVADGLVVDRFAETEVHAGLLAGLVRGLPGLRRLDVQFAPGTPLTAHDAVVGKTDQGGAFVALLAALLHLDLDGRR